MNRRRFRLEGKAASTPHASDIPRQLRQKAAHRRSDDGSASFAASSLPVYRVLDHTFENFVQSARRNGPIGEGFI
jgi:hypothetical protein